MGILKTSAVRIAAGHTDRVYRSLQDLPADLRDRLQQAINGPESETILIADEKGREQILAILRELPPETQNRVLTALRMRGAAAPQSKAVRGAVLFAVIALLTLLVWWIWISARSVSLR